MRGTSQVDHVTSFNFKSGIKQMDKRLDRSLPSGIWLSVKLLKYHTYVKLFIAIDK